MMDSARTAADAVVHDSDQRTQTLINAAKAGEAKARRAIEYQRQLQESGRAALRESPAKTTAKGNAKADQAPGKAEGALANGDVQEAGEARGKNGKADSKADGKGTKMAGEAKGKNGAGSEGAEVKGVADGADSKGPKMSTDSKADSKADGKGPKMAADADAEAQRCVCVCVCVSCA